MTDVSTLTQTLHNLTSPKGDEVGYKLFIAFVKALENAIHYDSTVNGPSFQETVTKAGTALANHFLTKEMAITTVVEESHEPSSLSPAVQPGEEKTDELLTVNS